MENDFIVTTSYGASFKQQEKAKQVANYFDCPYIERGKSSLKKLIGASNGSLVVYKSELIFVHRDGSRLAFHPDTAMLRIKNGQDPLVDLLGQAPKRILDATMGLANDSLVMAFQGHSVTALEINPLIHLIVSSGLATYVSNFEPLTPVMRTIKTYHINSLDYLRRQENKAFDVVYFDPMFRQKLGSSPDFLGLRNLAEHRRVTVELIDEAKRVAKDYLIIKAYYKDSIFEDFGFERQERANTKFHYGILSAR